jgi:hypothetical protein
MTRAIQSRPLFSLDKLNEIKPGPLPTPAVDPGLADEVGERLGFGEGPAPRSPAHDLQAHAEQAIVAQRGPSGRPELPPRLEALSPREATRIPVRDEPAPPPRERVSLQRRLPEASDLVGIRLPVAEANRFKLFATRHRLTAGEALVYLLDTAHIRSDGSVDG